MINHSEEKISKTEFHNRYFAGLTRAFGVDSSVMWGYKIKQVSWPWETSATWWITWCKGLCGVPGSVSWSVL